MDKSRDKRGHRTLTLGLLMMLSASPHASGFGWPWGKPEAGMEVSHIVPIKEVTHYSATPDGEPACIYECMVRKNGVGSDCKGGSNKAAYAGVPRPLEATYEKGGASTYGRRAVMAAVPRVGGNAGMSKCFFKLRGLPGSNLPRAYERVLFFGGDHYGSGSNHSQKVDVSSECSPKVDVLTGGVTYSGVEAIVFDCPGKKGGPGVEIARGRPRSSPGARGGQRFRRSFR